MEKRRKFHPKKKQQSGSPKPELTRLNKYIANSGACSRREADTLISEGKVRVNGKIVKELGTKVRPGDTVKLAGKLLQPEKLVYVLLNKPKDFITTTDDPFERKTVMHLVRKACSERIYPVGRLDRNTTGLLLFTNDGDLSKKLSHPRYNVKKVYQVTLDHDLAIKDMERISKGIQLEDGPIKADEVAYTKSGKKNVIGIELHSGRNRIVRRIFEHLGYKVVGLDRIYFAGLTKKDLPRGKYRMLKSKEVALLKMRSGR